MPRDPKTGQFVSQEVYDAIVAEEGHPDPAAYPHHELPPVRYVERQRASPLTAILLLAVIVMGGFIIWQSTRGPIGPVPVVVPDNSVSTLVAPIKAKLAQDPAKAVQVFQAYSGLRDALAGTSGARVIDTRVFAAVTTALLTDIDAAGGIPIGGDIDRAVATHLGISWGRDGSDDPEGWEFKKFGPAERAKLVEIVGAIARAAEAAS